VQTDQTISIDRQWQILKPAEDPRDAFDQAAKRLGAWRIDFAGVAVDRFVLETLARTPSGEPMLRALRELLRRPVDLNDFLFFLDDVLHAGAKGLRGQKVYITSGRARAVGILVHPDDVWKNRPRVYAAKGGTLAIDEPAEPAQLSPAVDGDLLGANWASRFQNPEIEEDMLEALEDAAPSSTFTVRLRALMSQLRDQGAEVYLTSTVRLRERGYLMWGAFYLSQSNSPRTFRKRLARVRKHNRSWGLNIPIHWQHPDGWRASVESARLMKEAYDVVYATERGARYSKHYGGVAADLTAVGLPRTLVLRAPSGAEKSFDLSDPSETRDLSLTPRLIEWIEQHFAFSKLLADYPHWSDVAPKVPVEASLSPSVGELSRSDADDSR